MVNGKLGSDGFSLMVESAGQKLIVEAPNPRALYQGVLALEDALSEKPVIAESFNQKVIFPFKDRYLLWDVNPTGQNKMGIGSWFYQAVGGIRLADEVPAYRKVIIQPQIPQGITWAKTFKETPYDKLIVDWELKEETMELEVEIPVGTEAGIILPSVVKKYRLNGREYELTGEKSAVVEVKSGNYKFNYSL